MLQDIAPHKFDNVYNCKNADENDFVLLYNDNKVLLKNACLPSYKDVKNFINAQDLLYLFCVDEKKFFLSLNFQISDNKSFCLQDVKIFREFEPKWAAFALITGFSLYKWYKSRIYCGCCGKKTEHSAIERAVVCKNCGNIEYPKIAPAVIVAVYNNDKLLMTKYSNNAYKKYALIAGYVEVGETLEQAAKREVMEEVGLKIKNLKYYNSQPWANTEALLAGFFAQLDGSDEIILDKSELKEARWFKKDEIMPEDTTLSLTWDMIEHFKTHKI